MSEIKINCETLKVLELDKMTEFQGGLKSRTNEDYSKIRKSIEQKGFSFPFFVWKHDGINHILDGHGRFETLKKMQNSGVEIPALPVVYVNCKDEKDAKDLLLRLNSQYGHMTKESVLDFIGDYDFNLDNFQLPDTDIDFSYEEDKEKTKEDDDGMELQEKYEVIVTCANSEEQETAFYKLTDMGFDVRISTM